MTASSQPGIQPDASQLHWLSRGLSQPGGKLPLFDEDGQRVDQALVKSCVAAGWAERWFNNPLKPDWVVCRLTDAGRTILVARLEGAKKYHSGDTSQA
ncbi:membrane protein [Skermanella stibiiresistens SB22]|uniref:Membrane protein n=1 Tax=Skermanella stibiiresistens SB22 TaxID=1385369 RepID=W9GZB0_9PROT|nr:hypothetical protein [Skermanella stibiiresistens]EWY39265.1 membrane protein [Skermanella stibiiresistens SB22]